MDLIEDLDESVPEKKELQATVKRLIAAYDALSKKYHTEKADNPDNSLVLGWTYYIHRPPIGIDDSDLPLGTNARVVCRRVSFLKY